MPAPTDVFIEIAARHGGVDPGDLLAVQRWYEHELENLPEETIDRILDELLSHEGTRSATPTTRCSPGSRSSRARLRRACTSRATHLRTMSRAGPSPPR